MKLTFNDISVIIRIQIKDPEVLTNEQLCCTFDCVLSSEKCKIGAFEVSWVTNFHICCT